MENPEDMSSSPEETTNQLNRNRSFKSKQLVRSQAIREAASPPHALSPPPAASTAGSENSDDSSHRCSEKKLPVEIQITSGGWDESSCTQRQRARRWLSDSPRDLLSNSPRVACVCGTCACPNCRGRRRRHACPTKQDSGIVCSDECPDCTDVDTVGSNHNDIIRKSASLDVDDQAHYCRCPDRKDRPKNVTLSRNDSGDYSKYDRNEPTGPELVSFLKDTLNKNPRDRIALLKIEKELHSLINDTGRCIVRFPVMTSYGRMLVHRCASLFQLSHHLDTLNKTCVLVSKSGTCGGRIPCTSFKEWCTATFPPSPQRLPPDVHHAKSILKRDAHSLDEPGSGPLSSNRSKSLEQREKDYERVRRRIFNSQDEAQWPWLTSGPVKLLTPETGRNKLLKVQSLEGSGVPAVNNWRNRGPVSKSHSFGGYTGSDTHQPRLLSRQGDLASSSWRLSPSSSGYKTLSLRSTDSITPSPTGGASPEPAACVGSTVPGVEGVVWAVTDMSAVPTGAVVIHPQTGRPLTNPDGSVYHFDPANPPVLYDPTATETHDDEQKPIDQNEKRRGRLEKQHSFIDNECDCQPSEESRNKCCCEYRRHEVCHRTQRTSEKETNTQPSPKPTTPISEPPQPIQTQTVQTQQPEPIKPIETKQIPETVETTNQRAFDNQITTNQKTLEIETNKQRAFENPIPTNQKTFEIENSTKSTNQWTGNDSRQRAFKNQIPTNQKTFEIENSTESTNQWTGKDSRQRAFENQITTNQKTFDNEKSIESTNQWTGNDWVNENQEIHYSQQYRGYRIGEVTSPPHIAQNHYVQDMSQQMLHNKMTPLPLPDPNIRPMSLTNMTNVIYPSAVAQGYPYQVRVDPQLHMYQQVLQPEEQRLPTPPHTGEGTFRIDPSYPYAAVDYTGAACGACVDTTSIQHQQRSYSVPYSQVDVPQVLPHTYSVGNVLLPQPHLQHYPYQEQVPWPQVAAAPKLVVPELYQTMVPYPQTTYPHYNIMYPQVIPQPYQICQPIYPIIEPKQPERRNSIPNTRYKRSSIPNSSRNTPDKSAYEEQARQAEIAAKIQQIKSQMAQLEVKDNKPERTDRTDWKEGRRRNCGNGILGHCPVNNINGRFMGRSQEETHLSSAARAIVNSIRNMQAKTNAYQDNRRDYQRYDKDRPRRYDRAEQFAPTAHAPATFAPAQHVSAQHVPAQHAPASAERGDVRSRVHVPVYRQPYLLRQMSPGTWCRRSPAPVHPVLNQPRRQYPDGRNPRYNNKQ